MNNYKSTHKKFREKYAEKDLAIVIKKSELKQKLFHEHYSSEGHQGIENWSAALINQVEDLGSLRKKKLYWINRLNILAPNGLNVRQIYWPYNLVKKGEKKFLEKALKKVLHWYTHEDVF